MNAATSSQAVCFVPKGVLQGHITPPGSKSISNRALICAALGTGVCRLQNMLISEDTEVMIDAWRQLGLRIDFDPVSKECVVHGCNGSLPNKSGEIYVANSGTTIRFLTAALAACEGQFKLDGVARMRARPIGDLISALRELGADIESVNEENPQCPPLFLKAKGLASGTVQVPGDVSSQFLSGLMMAAPYAQGTVQIQVTGQLVSKPYVAMTVAVMKSFGVDVAVSDECYSIDGPQHYHAEQYVIEPDASAASYYLAAAAITRGEVTVRNLGTDSLQGDVKFADVLREMGCEVEVANDSIFVRGKNLRGIDIDMNSISDTVQTLAAVALFAEGPTRVRGVAHNRFKETDRIADLACELRRVGAEVDEHADGLTITPKTTKPATVETYNDHRMAMSMSLVGLRQPEIWITNPGCTAKTYPHFFEDMQQCFGLDIQRSGTASQ